MKIRFYYQKKNGSYRVLNDKTNKVTTVSQLDPNAHNYYLFKGFDLSKAGLREFRSKFHQWNKELGKFIDYRKYPSHRQAVIGEFNRLSITDISKFNKETGEDIRLWNQLPKIDSVEYGFITKCSNHGKYYFDKSVIGKETKAYTYDYNNFFPRTLGSTFRMPYRSGEQKTITTLDDNPPFGIYRVRITSDHPDATKLFVFNKHDTYTHKQIGFVQYELKDYDFKCELIIDGKPNAYVYKHVVKASSIFGNWYKKLVAIKRRYPKNQLIKFLLSGLWGHLCVRYSTIPLTEDEYIDKMNDVEVVRQEVKSVDEVIYHCRKKMFNYNLARLMPWMNGSCHLTISRLVRPYLDSLIRIYVDSFTFTKRLDLHKTKLNIKQEDKTTGTLLFQNIRDYEKLT